MIGCIQKAPSDPIKTHIGVFAFVLELVETYGVLGHFVVSEELKNSEGGYLSVTDCSILESNFACAS